MRIPARTALAPGASVAGAEVDKKTLLVRIGIAGVLILILIGALALFEQQSQPSPAVPDRIMPPAVTQSLPAPAAQNEASGAIAPSAGAPVSKPEAPAEPEATAAPQTAAPAVGQAEHGGKGGIDKRAQPVREDTQPRLIVGKGSEPPAVTKTLPAPEAASAKPAAPEPAPAGRASGSGFVVQVGVFSNLANAEELRKKLIDAGIPAQIEARVQVGPFATQAQASAAQKKLKSLGMEPGMLLAPRR